MGAGKTTVGKQLAKRLGREFFDSDHEIVAKTGVPIPTIFEIEGEEGFRRRETQAIIELSKLTGVVVATGGGVVLSPENCINLTKSGWVVYLSVPPLLLLQRTRGDKNRPLLQVDDPLGRLEALFAVRDPLYRAIANLVVEGGQQQASNIVHHLLREYARISSHDSTS